MTPASTGRPGLRRYLRSCIWLLVPVLVLNVAFTPSLPAPYQPDEFGRDIPTAISLVEQLSRTALFIMVALVPLELRTRAQRLGARLFAGGFAVYAGSWAALIVAPHSAWATSALGFSAPAWTPALWLAGLVLLAERSFVSRWRSPRAALAGCAALFLAVHVSHALLVFARVRAG